MPITSKIQDPPKYITIIILGSFPSLQINPEHKKSVAYRGRSVQKPSKAKILVRKHSVSFLFACWVCFVEFFFPLKEWTNYKKEYTGKKKFFMHYSTLKVHTSFTIALMGS